MPLRPEETCQCECCEEYCRLGELQDVRISKDKQGYDAVLAHPKTGFVGLCPNCGNSVDTTRIG